MPRPTDTVLDGASFSALFFLGSPGSVPPSRGRAAVVLAGTVAAASDGKALAAPALEPPLKPRSQELKADLHGDSSTAADLRAIPMLGGALTGSAALHGAGLLAVELGGALTGKGKTTRPSVAPALLTAGGDLPKASAGNGILVAGGDL